MTNDSLTIEEQPSELNWARLAAYIDSEGCIRIFKSRIGSHGYVSHEMLVTVCNIDPRFINWLKQTFGGAIHKVSKGKLGKRQCYAWKISARQAETVLKNVLPFLIIKKEQAEIALAFRETKHQHGKWVSAETFAKRDELMERLSALKWREYPALTIQ